MSPVLLFVGPLCTAHSIRYYSEEKGTFSARCCWVRCSGETSCCCCSRKLPLQESPAGLPQRGEPSSPAACAGESGSESLRAGKPSWDTQVSRHLRSLTYRPLWVWGGGCRILPHTPQAQDLAHSALLLLISFLILPFIDGDNLGLFSFGPECRLFRGMDASIP